MENHITKLLVILTLTLTGDARAAVDIFLKLDGVPGESRDARHGNEIDVLSWGFEVDQSKINWASGTASPVKSTISPIKITKYLDSVSPLLFIHSLLGTKLGKDTLVVRKASENPLESLVITLTDLVVCNYSTGGSGVEDRFTKQVGLSYRTIKVHFVPQLHWTRRHADRADLRRGRQPLAVASALREHAHPSPFT